MTESLQLALDEVKKTPAEDILHIEHKYKSRIVVDREDYLTEGKEVKDRKISFITEKSLPIQAHSLADKVKEFNIIMEMFENHQDHNLSIEDLRAMVGILDTMLSIAEMRKLVSDYLHSDI